VESNILMGIVPNSTIRTLISMSFIGVAGWVALRSWRRKENQTAGSSDDGFRPRIVFTRREGWVSLNLNLENPSQEKIWAEEAELVLTELVAQNQTAEAPLREIQKIRQTINPGDMLPISLAEAIYKAAGKPQSTYNSLLSATVRYRSTAGDVLSEIRLPTYRIVMASLKARNVSRVRWYH
jgi:hypothetical protein